MNHEFHCHQALPQRGNVNYFGGSCVPASLYQVPRYPFFTSHFIS